MKQVTITYKVYKHLSTTLNLVKEITISGLDLVTDKHYQIVVICIAIVSIYCIIVDDKNSFFNGRLSVHTALFRVSHGAASGDRSFTRD